MPDPIFASQTASRTATQDGPKKESPSIHLAGLSGFPTGGSLRFGWPMVGRFQVVVVSLMGTDHVIMTASTQKGLDS